MKLPGFVTDSTIAAVEPLLFNFLFKIALLVWEGEVGDVLGCAAMT